MSKVRLVYRLFMVVLSMLIVALGISDTVAAAEAERDISLSIL